MRTGVPTGGVADPLADGETTARRRPAGVGTTVTAELPVARSGEP